MWSFKLHTPNGTIKASGTDGNKSVYNIWRVRRNYHLIVYPVNAKTGITELGPFKDDPMEYYQFQNILFNDWYCADCFEQTESKHHICDSCMNPESGAHNLFR